MGEVIDFPSQPDLHKPVQLQAIITMELYDYFQTRLADEGISTASLFARALLNQEIIRGAQQAGGKVFIRKPGGVDFIFPQI